MHGSHRAGRTGRPFCASSPRIAVLFLLLLPPAFPPPALAVTSPFLFDGFRPPVGQQPDSIAQADLNADGKLDLVVGNCGSQDVSVLLGNGDGTFAPQVRYPVGGCPGQIVILDFTSDGKPDLAMVVGGSIVLLAGDGAGGFPQASTAAPAPNAAKFLYGGDFNGDGKKDLASVSSYPFNLMIFLGNGDGTFQDAALYPTAGAQSLVEADFNGDGRTDFATFFNGTGYANVWAHLGNPDGTFTTSYSATVSVPWPLIQFFNPVLIAGEFNDDPYSDLAIYDSGLLYVLAGQGGGTFIRPSDVPLEQGGGQLVPLVGDLDGDGRDDIVSFGLLTVDFYRQGIGGAFEYLGTHAAGSSSPAAVLADLNGDGSPDLAVLNDESDDVSILLAPNFYSPGPEFHTPTSAPVESLVTADLREDGKPDLVAISMGWNGFQEFLGTGGGKFDSNLRLAPSVGGVMGVVAADFSGDGHQDVVVNGTIFPVAEFVGRGDGTFNPSPRFYQPTDSYGPIWSDDFNGDGYRDLVLRETSTGVMILGGAGGGDFSPPVEISPDTHVWSLASGDLNGDGKPDIVMGSEAISLLFGNGDLTFTQGPTFALPGFAMSVTVADLNGDSYPEIVAALDDGEVAVLKNDGKGGFTTTRFPAGKLLYGIAVADFNGDGIPDVAVSDSAENALTILLGNGDGSLGDPLRFQTDYELLSLAAADFDSDGRMDLALGFTDATTSPGSSNELVVYLNHGPFPPCHDADGDGYGSPSNLTCPAGEGLDCDDSNAAIHPGQAEICDGRDNNCDGKVDEGFPDTDGDGVADCVDNCTSIWNPGQADSNGNGIGDVCEEAALFAAANLSTADFSANRVDGRDLGIFAGAFGTCPGDAGFDAAANLDRVPDAAGPPGSCVGAADFHLFMEEFAKVH